MLTNYERNGSKGLRAVAIVFLVVGCIAALFAIGFLLQLILGNDREQEQAAMVLAALVPVGTLMFFFAFASRALATVADYAKRKLDEYDYASSDDESE